MATGVVFAATGEVAVRRRLQVGNLYIKLLRHATDPAFDIQLRQAYLPYLAAASRRARVICSSFSRC